jgi:ribosomal protein S18 acetylase RimI-like enzyme
MDRTLAGLVHRNLMEVSSWMGEAPGGACYWADGELFFAGPSDTPFLNGVMREEAGGDPDELLDRARSFFFERRRGFVAFAWPGDTELEEAALAAGMFPVLDRYPEMVCHREVDILPGEVRPVQSLKDAESYWEICDVAYPSLGFPPGLFSEAFDPRDLLDDARVRAYLAYENGLPVACASVWLAAGVGMVGWVAALPQSRGHGLAGACTVHATNQAFELGADVASLQASHMGEGLYRRLGYEEVFSYRLLGAMPS